MHKKKSEKQNRKPEDGAFLNTAGKLLQKRRRWLRWQRLVAALAAVVVFCTAYALILPAITLTGDNTGQAGIVTTEGGDSEDSHTTDTAADSSALEGAEAGGDSYDATALPDDDANQDTGDNPADTAGDGVLSDDGDASLSGEDEDTDVMLLSNELTLYWNPYDQDITDPQSGTVTYPAGNDQDYTGQNATHPLLTWAKVAAQIESLGVGADVTVYVMTPAILGRATTQTSTVTYDGSNYIVPQNLSISKGSASSLTLRAYEGAGSVPELFIIPNHDATGLSDEAGITGGTSTTEGTLSLTDVTLATKAGSETTSNVIRIIGGEGSAGGQLILNSGVALSGVVQTQLDAEGASIAQTTSLGSVIYNPIQVNALPTSQIMLYYSSVDTGGVEYGAIDDLTYYGAVVIEGPAGTDIANATLSDGTTPVFTLDADNTAAYWTLQAEGTAKKTTDASVIVDTHRIELGRTDLTYDAVYVDGIHGDDTNTGESCANSVQTMERALALVADDTNWRASATTRTIYVCNTLEVSTTKTWDASSVSAGVTVVVAPHATSTNMLHSHHTISPATLVNVEAGGSLTIKSLTFRQVSPTDESADPSVAVNVEAGASLTVGAGSAFSNEQATTDSAGTTTYAAYERAIAIKATGSSSGVAAVNVEAGAEAIGEKYTLGVKLTGADGLRTQATMAASGTQDAQAGSFQGAVSIEAENATVSLDHATIEDAADTTAAAPDMPDGASGIAATNCAVTLTNATVQKSLYGVNDATSSGQTTPTDSPAVIALSGSDFTATGTTMHTTCAQAIDANSGSSVALVNTNIDDSFAVDTSRVGTGSLYMVRRYSLDFDDSSTFAMSGGSISLARVQGVRISKAGTLPAEGSTDTSTLSARIENGAGISAARYALTLNSGAAAQVTDSAITGTYSGTGILLAGAAAKVQNSAIASADRANNRLSSSGRDNSINHAIDVQASGEAASALYMSGGSLGNVTSGRSDAGQGSALRVTGGTASAAHSVTLKDSVQISSVAPNTSYSGSVYLADYMNLSLENTLRWTGTHYYYMPNGSCLYFASSFVPVDETGDAQSTFTLEGFTFQANSSDSGTGGAVYFDNVAADVAFTLKNCTFAWPEETNYSAADHPENCRASCSGIYFARTSSTPASTLTLEGCTLNSHGTLTNPVENVIYVKNTYDSSASTPKRQSFDEDGTAVSVKSTSLDENFAQNVVVAEAGITIGAGTHANNNTIGDMVQSSNTWRLTGSVVSLFTATRGRNNGANLDRLTISGNTAAAQTRNTEQLLASGGDVVALRSGDTATAADALNSSGVNAYAAGSDLGKTVSATGLTVTNNQNMTGLVLGWDTWKIENASINGNGAGGILGDNAPRTLKTTSVASGELTMKNSSVSSNTGYGVRLVGTKATFEDTSVNANTAAALTKTTYVYSYYTSPKWTATTTELTGYGVFSLADENTEVSFVGGSVSQNAAKTGKGVVEVADGATLAFKQSSSGTATSFTSNASSGGTDINPGVFYITGGTLTIEDASVTNNTTTGDGAVIYSAGGEATFKAGTYTGNTPGSFTSTTANDGTVSTSYGRGASAYLCGTEGSLSILGGTWANTNAYTPSGEGTDYAYQGTFFLDYGVGSTFSFTVDPWTSTLTNQTAFLNTKDAQVIIAAPEGAGTATTPSALPTSVRGSVFQSGAVLVKPKDKSSSASAWWPSAYSAQFMGTDAEGILTEDVEEPNIVLIGQGIYLDGESGSDANGGTSPSDAVQTWARARELLASSITNANSATDTTFKPYIYICGTVKVNKDEIWQISAADADLLQTAAAYTTQGTTELTNPLADTFQPEIRRYGNFFGNMVEVAAGASLTVSNTYVNGMASNLSAQEASAYSRFASFVIAPATEAAGQGTLTLSGTTRVGNIYRNAIENCGGALVVQDSARIDSVQAGGYLIAFYSSYDDTTSTAAPTATVQDSAVLSTEAWNIAQDATGVITTSTPTAALGQAGLADAAWDTGTNGVAATFTMEDASTLMLGSAATDVFNPAERYKPGSTATDDEAALASILAVPRLKVVLGSDGDSETAHVSVAFSDAASKTSAFTVREAELHGHATVAGAAGDSDTVTYAFAATSLSMDGSSAIIGNGTNDAGFSYAMTLPKAYFDAETNHEDKEVPQPKLTLSGAAQITDLVSAYYGEGPASSTAIYPSGSRSYPKYRQNLTLPAISMGGTSHIATSGYAIHAYYYSDSRDIDGSLTMTGGTLESTAARTISVEGYGNSSTSTSDMQAFSIALSGASQLVNKQSEVSTRPDGYAVYADYVVLNYEQKGSSKVSGAQYEQYNSRATVYTRYSHCVAIGENAELSGITGCLQGGTLLTWDGTDPSVTIDGSAQVSLAPGYWNSNVSTYFMANSQDNLYGLSTLGNTYNTALAFHGQAGSVSIGGSAIISADTTNCEYARGLCVLPAKLEISSEVKYDSVNVTSVSLSGNAKIENFMVGICVSGSWSSTEPMVSMKDSASIVVPYLASGASYGICAARGGLVRMGDSASIYASGEAGTQSTYALYSGYYRKLSSSSVAEKPNAIMLDMLDSTSIHDMTYGYVTSGNAIYGQNANSTANENSATGFDGKDSPLVSVGADASMTNIEASAILVQGGSVTDWGSKPIITLEGTLSPSAAWYAQEMPLIDASGSARVFLAKDSQVLLDAATLSADTDTHPPAIGLRENAYAAIDALASVGGANSAGSFVAGELHLYNNLTAAVLVNTQSAESTSAFAQAPLIGYDTAHNGTGIIAPSSVWDVDAAATSTGTTPAANTASTDGTPIANAADFLTTLEARKAACIPDDLSTWAAGTDTWKNWIVISEIPDVYISNTGDDTNSGKSADDPVRTFARAIEILEGKSVGGGNILFCDAVTPADGDETWELVADETKGTADGEVKNATGDIWTPKLMPADEYVSTKLDAYSYYKGGFIYFPGRVSESAEQKTYTFKNLSFDGNGAARIADGLTALTGVIDTHTPYASTYSNTLNVEGCTFQNVNVDSSAGGRSSYAHYIYAYSGLIATIRDTDFIEREDVPGGTGSAIYSYGATLTLENVTLFGAPNTQTTRSNAYLVEAYQQGNYTGSLTLRNVSVSGAAGASEATDIGTCSSSYGSIVSVRGTSSRVIPVSINGLFISGIKVSQSTTFGSSTFSSGNYLGMVNVYYGKLSVDGGMSGGITIDGCTANFRNITGYGLLTIGSNTQVEKLNGITLTNNTLAFARTAAGEVGTSSCTIYGVLRLKPTSEWTTTEASNITVSGNTTKVGAATESRVYGAGLYVTGTLSITGGDISNNRVETETSGTTVGKVNISGGGIYAAGTSLTLANVSVNGNEARQEYSETDNNSNKKTLVYGQGGGIYVAGGALSMTGGEVKGNSASTSFDANRAAGSGGGIYLAGTTVTSSSGTSGGGTLSLSGTTVADNTASSTASKNTTGGGAGGGIYVARYREYSNSNPREVTSTSVSLGGGTRITGNTASGQGAAIYYPAKTSGYENTLNIGAVGISGNTCTTTSLADTLSYEPVYIGGSGTSVTASGAIVSDAIYLDNTDCAITLATAITSNTSFTLHPNVGTDSTQFKRGSVVVKPDGTVVRDAQIALTNFTVEAQGYTLAAQSPNLVLKGYVFLDGVNGADGTDSGGTVHDGTTPEKAYKTLEYALSDLQSSSAEQTYAYTIFYVCNTVTPQGSWDLSGAVVDGALTSELARYTGFSLLGDAEGTERSAHTGVLVEVPALDSSGQAVNISFTNVAIKGRPDSDSSGVGNALLRVKGTLSLGDGVYLLNNTNVQTSGRADSGIGGALWVDGGAVSITGEVTISGNEATNGTAVYQDGSFTLASSSAKIDGDVCLAKAPAGQGVRVLNISDVSVVPQRATTGAGDSRMVITVKDPSKGRNVVVYDDGTDVDTTQRDYYRLDTITSALYNLIPSEETGEQNILELEPKRIIYIDGVNGDDIDGATQALTEEGSVPDEAFETFEGVFAFLNNKSSDGVVIMVVNTVTVTSGFSFTTSLTGGTNDNGSTTFVCADGTTTYTFAAGTSIMRYSQPDFAKNDDTAAAERGYSSESCTGALIEIACADASDGTPQVSFTGVQMDGHSYRIDAGEDTFIADAVAAKAPLINVAAAAEATASDPAQDAGAVSLTNVTMLANNNDPDATPSSGGRVHGGALAVQEGGVAILANVTIGSDDATYTCTAERGSAIFNAAGDGTDGGALKFSANQTIYGEIFLSGDGHSISDDTADTDAGESWLTMTAVDARNSINDGDFIFDMATGDAFNGRPVVKYTTTNAPDDSTVAVELTSSVAERYTAGVRAGDAKVAELQGPDGYELPYTGGAGTGMFYAFGILLLAAALGVFLKKRA